MKVRRISQFQKKINFPNFDEVYEEYLSSFKQTDLGKIYSAIPWDKMVQALGLKEQNKGPESIFSPRGKLALMFLKHYCGCSDRKLMDQFNGNIYYQIFCDTLVEPGQHLTNYKIISQIRCEISKGLNIDELESVLMDHWRPYMTNLNSITCDATCYESDMRYPTDVKLLWESVDWTYAQLKKICGEQKVRTPRTKYLKWVGRYVSYSKMRKKTKKKRRSLTRAMLRLLNKIDKELTILEALCPERKTTDQYKQRRQTIQTILVQQSDKFYEDKTPKGAIVSIDKAYVRPIVRGKETKRVEFGAKVHKLQIDGISFIEHLSFNAFNESTRLSSTLFKAHSLTRTAIKIFGADAIYATNKNRKTLTSKEIQTDFKIKGRPGRHHEHKSQIAKMITKERASRLEGSFGTDKEYFLLKKIKARTQRTEKLWIFFGIHTSNALNIGNRISAQAAKAA